MSLSFRQTDALAPARRLRFALASACALIALVVVGTSLAAEDAGEDAAGESIEVPQRLLDRPPFDRVTLDAANQGAVIESVLLDLPDRRKLRPFPKQGSLKIRRLNNPSTPYEASWSAIATIELYEEMLLAEAQRLTAAGALTEAFEYFGFLLKNYPDLPGIEDAAQDHLWQDAAASFREKRLEDALASLLALYDRNPAHPRLAGAVDAVSDVLVTQRLAEGDFASARTVIDMLEASFPQAKLASVAKWRRKFRDDAATELARGRRALAAGEFAAARAAVTHARAIDPGIEGAAALLAKIQDAAPEIRVGVLQRAQVDSGTNPLEWATVRARGLTDPQLIEMPSFSAEGGDYESHWAKIDTDDEGVVTTLSAGESGRRYGITAAAIARRFLAMARPEDGFYSDGFAALAAAVDSEGDEVRITWRRPHIRPAALLTTPLRGLGGPAAAELWFERDTEQGTPAEARYARAAMTDEPPEASTAPRYIVEQAFDDDEGAAAALAGGSIDLLDRVPPWQVERLTRADGVRVGRYRLPTVHVLLLNYDNPLLELREFRRALCYGTDRQGIVRDLLLAGREQIGFRVLSGPFLAGENSTDPIGYAYLEQLAPRPYEPRLASVLASVARGALAKRSAASDAASQSAETDDAATDEDDSNSSDESEENGDDKPAAAPPTPLRLAHAGDPVARLACQSIKSQLDQVGIPVELIEIGSEEDMGADGKYDLVYAELAMWDPIVDARRLLGPRGIAGQSSAYMSLALDRLERAENWSQVIQRAKELHRIAHYDLPVIPLWQTVNYYAYRDWLQGVGEGPVTLYQNLPQWRKSFADGDQP
ncbi:MAG: hypothetical protein KF847_12055 [Pirellulales bacterium]|nr:hypothetical protein [Pirellulales bacterium]